MAKSKAQPKLHNVICLRWFENERETGESFGAAGRPDGASLHLTSHDYTVYRAKHWDSRDTREPTPDAYNYPDEQGPSVLNVDGRMYNKIKTSGGSLRIGSATLSEIKTKPYNGCQA